VSKHRKLIILGSGPAGYTAGIYSSRANLNPLIISGRLPGGQLMTTTDVDNWPGEKNGIQGPDLMENFQKQAERFGTEIVHDEIKDVLLNHRPFSLVGETCTYTCDSLIIATGASAKYLGLSSETKFLGRGVSSCATCDGYFYKNKEVAVVGGGNTAVEESLFLSNIASRVTLIHRRDRLKSEKILEEKILKRSLNGRIKIIWSSEVKEILGDDKKGVHSMQIINNITSKEEFINVSGIFIAIGHSPNTKIFKNKIDIDNNGYIKVKSGLSGQYTSTNIKGVYAAGDVIDSIYRQAVTSAATGCMAAIDSEKYLDSLM